MLVINWIKPLFQGQKLREILESRFTCFLFGTGSGSSPQALITFASSPVHFSYNTFDAASTLRVLFQNWAPLVASLGSSGMALLSHKMTSKPTCWTTSFPTAARLHWDGSRVSTRLVTTWKSICEALLKLGARPSLSCKDTSTMVLVSVACFGHGGCGGRRG